MKRILQQLSFLRHSRHYNYVFIRIVKEFGLKTIEVCPQPFQLLLEYVLIVKAELKS
jgi:hypothetical protein